MADLVQTHRTIIFEEFDSKNSNNLYTLLNSNPSGKELTIGLAKLTVTSFKQFMKDFAPKVYEVYGRNSSGKIEFFYATDPQKYPEFLSKPLDIIDHIYYKMLARLYSSKGTSGNSNLEFKDEEILEMLTPKKELDEVNDLRQSIDYNLKCYQEAEARGDKSAMRSYGERNFEYREKIAEYATSSLTRLLPILIEDVNKKLELLESNLENDDEDTKALSAPTLGVLYLNADGKLDIDENWKEKRLAAIAAPKDSKGGELVTIKNNLPAEVKTISPQVAEIPDPKVETQKLRNEFAATIESDYDELAENPSEIIKSLIVSTFMPLADTQDSEKPTDSLDKEKLLQLREMYESVYTNARKSFINEMSKIVESLIGVKTFFDHATVESGDEAEIPGGVIIANCKASKLIKIKDKFLKFMKQLGKDQTEHRIWFAVLPNVREEPPKKPSTGNDKNISGMGGSLKNRKKQAEKNDAEYVSINTLKEFLPEMENANVVTIFSIHPDKGNTFSELSPAEVESKMKLFNDSSYGRHAVYAYPNFTLIGERFFTPFKNRTDEDFKISLPAIVIDAAYPAAGLLVASQQHKILENRKLQIDKQTVCVGVDFENLMVKKAFQTKFNREEVLRRSEDLIKIINQSMFGFSFSGDDVKDKDGQWKNSYIHCARTLAKNDKTNLYKPIYQTLIEDFVALELKSLPSMSPAAVQQKIDEINQEWADKNKINRFKGCVNFLLRGGEYIGMRKENGTFKVYINFAGGEGYVEIEVADAPTEEENK